MADMISVASAQTIGVGGGILTGSSGEGRTSGGDEIIQIDMPFMTASEHTRLTVNGGWITEASVEDVKLLPGVQRTMFRLAGGEWVTREIVNQVKSGRARFVVDGGDVVWWGDQGRTVNDSPYWKRLNETMLSQLPAPGSEMRAAGLDGRWFIGLGNHEICGCGCIAVCRFLPLRAARQYLKSNFKTDTIPRDSELTSENHGPLSKRSEP
jgi:hypothetical protein